MIEGEMAATTLNLDLNYMEIQTLLSLVRQEAQQIKNKGTVSDWHDALMSLKSKIEMEAAQRDF